MHSNNTSQFKRVRLAVLQRDGYTCYLCGGYADQADHVWPKSKGGPDTMENLRAICARDNRKKSNKTHEQTTWINPKYRDGSGSAVL